MCHYMSRYARLFDPGAKSGQQGRDGDRVEKIERARDRTIAGRWPPRTRAVETPAHRRGDDGTEIGRASCRERVCQDVWISVGAVSLTKKKNSDKKLKKN